MPDAHRLYAVDGTEQQDRFPDPLREGYFRPDEMSFDDLVARSAEFASRLHFYDADKAEGLRPGEDLSHARGGTWGDLFASDEAVIMAEILSADPKRLHTECLERLERGVEDAATRLYQAAQRMNAWLRGLKAVEHQTGRALAATLADIIERSIAPAMHRMHAAMTAHSPDWAAQWDVSALDASWRRGADSAEQPLDVREAFHTALDGFVHTLVYLRTVTEPYARASLRSGVHSPGLALLLAFFRLYERAQAGVNALAPKHLTFYYEQVLRGVRRPPIPDMTWLVLRGTAGAGPAVVPAGTPFLAGRDSDGRDILFLSAHDVTVTDAQVRELAMLRLERNRLISPERELGYVNRARALRISAVDGRLNAWPVFGAEEKETCRVHMDDADLGFAVASPLLWLHEGTRAITIDVHLADPGDTDATVAVAMNALDAADPVLRVLEVLRRIYLTYLKVHGELLSRRQQLQIVDQAAAMATASLRDLGEARLRELLNGPQHRLYDRFLLQLLAQAESEDEFARVFGRIFRRRLLAADGAGPMFDEPSRTAIRAAAARTLKSASAGTLGQIEELITSTHGPLAHKLLARAFVISLSTASGWHTLQSYVIVLRREVDRPGELGLTLALRLGPDVEPIVAGAAAVHGSQWQTAHPLLRVQLNPVADFYAYSLFESLRVHEISIDVYVDGIRTLVAYNGDGRLDPSRPFLPFGALPATGSYLLVGNEEIALKPITELNVLIEWGGLPWTVGGFRTYYHDYPGDLDNDSFQVDVSVLDDGEWRPVEPARRRRLPLFRSDAGELVSPATVLPVDALRGITPRAGRRPQGTFAFDTAARSGFVRFTLVGPDGAFGHRDHTTLMTQTLWENSRLKRNRPLPNPPYTPLANRMSISYRARDVISASADPSGAQGATRHQVFQIHPFGTRLVYPSTGHGITAPLLPTYRFEGNLFIGIATTTAGGVLRLLFDMARDSTRELSSPEPAQAWFYLAGNRWRPLDPARVLSDTTHGFLRSGIVTLQLPDDLSTGNTLMPDGLLWLCTAASSDVSSFASLFSVATHGVQAKRRIDALPWSAEPIPEGTIRQPAASIPGVAGVRQVGPSFRGRSEEDTAAFHTRMSERLRHKNRASVPWDYERIVLDLFPDVFKVKCFPNIDARSTTPVAGRVLVVVVPAAASDTLSPRFDAVELARIRRVLVRRSSPFVDIDVRNPVYERIQVRCAVKFRTAGSTGLHVRRLNQAIVDFLSPWEPIGYKGRFGWRVRREDIESFIRSLDYVDFVTDFSMLHITGESGDGFLLADTARFWPIGPGAFANFQAFAAAIRSAPDAVSTYFRSHLAPDTRRALEQHDLAVAIPPALEDAILTDVNATLASAPLYEQERFAHVVLPEDTRSRVGQPLTGMNLVWLNRFLLEDCYPNVFLSSPARVEEIRPRSPWSIAIPMRTHAIEPLDALTNVAPEPTGIAELEVVTNFIIS